MKEIEFIRKLDAQTEPPAIDVSGQVLRRILRRQNSGHESRPMWLAAFVSCAAAALVLIVAIQAWNGAHDPFGDLLSPLMTGFQ